MSHALHRLSLLAAAALALGAMPCSAGNSPSPPDAATATCMQHLQAIGRALKSYQRANGHLPAHLSDLYPTYLKDKAAFHCPADPSPGDPNVQPGMVLPDPAMPVSYLYEMSADPATYTVPFGPAPDGKTTWLQQKTAQRAYFGDRVPVVRCWHHIPVPAGQTPLVPGVTLSGKVIRTVSGWEFDPATVPVLLTALERDLAAGPDQVRRRWPPDAVARYFAEAPPLPALHARLHAAAEKLAAVPGPFPHAAAGAQSAAVASLYGAAGEMDRAAAGYQAALDIPGDHTQIASLMAEQYFTAGQPEKAVAEVERLQAREPDNLDYTVLLAETYGRAGQPEKATAMQRRADQQSVGRMAPDFTFKDTGGHPVHLADLRGKAVLLYFWYYPAETSRDAAAPLEALKRKYQDQGLAVVALIPGASPQAIDFAGNTFTYPLLVNAVPAFDSYHITALPTLILIDREGKVAARHSGPSSDLGTLIEEDVKKLLPTPAP